MSSIRPSTPVKAALAALWILLLVLSFRTWQQSAIALQDVPGLLQIWLGEFGLAKAGFIYILLYTLRPIVLFPATLLTIAAGLVFGPWLGILFTIVGENASANLAFVIGRWFGRDFVKNREKGLLKRWEAKLAQNGLVTVLVIRLLYLPFDAVNFGCGLTAIRQRDYAIGTFLGILPGIVAFVLLGGIAAAGVNHRLLVLGASLLFLLFGLLLAHHLRRKTALPQSQDLPPT